MGEYHEGEHKNHPSVGGGEGAGRGVPCEEVICIGDIHGWLNRLVAVWAALEVELGPERLGRATVVFLGDYVDRGPDSRGVLDFLLALKGSRRAGATRFVAGNHDLGMAAFLHGLEEHVLPTGDQMATLMISYSSADGTQQFTKHQLDATREPDCASGYHWQHDCAGGMHYQGRRWGGSRVFEAASTFESYGVPFDTRPETREALKKAVPDSHKKFLRDMEWVVELDLLHYADDAAAARQEKQLRKVICVHAGLVTGEPAEPQLAALRNRGMFAPQLQNRKWGRFDCLSGRRNVEAMHPDFLREGKHTMLISGHHGTRWSNTNPDKATFRNARNEFEVSPPDELFGDRIILDVSGGSHGGLPLEAIILPSRRLISVSVPDTRATITTNPQQQQQQQQPTVGVPN